MPTAAVSRFLDLRSLSALSHLRFATRQRIEGAYSGRHRSKQQGGAGEFVDFREYTAGEDLRRLDWKVLARTGRAYVRLYQDETNLMCTMVVDASGSMLYAGQKKPWKSGSKLEYVQYLSTALSHVISQAQDQVGLAIISNGLKEYLPPSGGMIHVRRLQELIEKIPRRRTTTKLSDALRDLFQRAGRRGVLVILSDFLDDDPEAVFAALRLFRHRMWDIIVLHIVHPDEEQLPTGAAFRFEGLEQSGFVDCSPAEVRELYQTKFAAHCAMIRSLALTVSADYRRISTAIPYLDQLGQFLRARMG